MRTGKRQEGGGLEKMDGEGEGGRERGKRECWERRTGKDKEDGKGGRGMRTGKGGSISFSISI